MRLRTKLVLLMLAVMALFLAGIVVLRQVAIARADLLFRDKENEKGAYFDKLVDVKGASIATLAYDYTYWDEMVRFADAGDLEWATSQLDESVLTNYHVDALWVYKPDWSLVYSIDLAGSGPRQDIPLPMAARNRVLQGGSRFCHFFVETPQGILEVRGATIHPSDDNQRRTSPRGYFLVGRLWSDPYRKELEALTESRIAVQPISVHPAARRAELGDGTIRFERTLLGWDGRPAFRVTVVSESPTVREMYRSARVELIVLVSFATLLTVVLFLSLIAWVMRPLQLISRSLELESVDVLQGLLTDRAEFGQLARVLGRFFKQKGELVREVHERQRAEEQLRHDAFHDALTGLANRALFMDRLQNAMERAKRHDQASFAVLFIDLDRFKTVNDSLGHMKGDELLRIVGRRLASCLRGGDLVARLGGDEFGILLEAVRGEGIPLVVAERIQQELAPGIDLGGHEVFTGASIGIALSSSAYDRPEEVLRDADTAMYQAKTLGKAQHVVFHDALGTQVMTALTVEAALRRAVERDELRVHYQPVVSVGTGEIRGFEALVRWEHPERGLLQPADFIHVAEESGLVVAVDEWVLREACKQMVRWERSEEGSPRLTLAVNLSTRQVAQAGLVGRVARILEETGFDPRRLRLEITEGALLDNSDAVTRTLSGLTDLGIRLCLDDFGTGYSSLNYLHRFRIDTLKIDRSFAGRILESENLEIVRAIVMLARALRMVVVAEGIETEEQLERLKQLECEFAQGYFFSPPLESEAAWQLLAPGDLAEAET